MENYKIERGIIFYVWIYALTVSLVLVFINPKYIIYFVLGVATNLFCFTTTIKTIDRAIQLKGENTKGMFIINNLIKLAMYTIVLVVVALSTTKADRPAHIIICFVGMLSVKLMIYFKHLVVEKIKERRQNKRIKENEHE